MRTTLDIADDVLFAAKEIAQRDKKPVGQVIGDLARRALASPYAAAAPLGTMPAPARAEQTLAPYGIHPLPPRGAVVTNAIVNQLREQEGI